MKLFVWLSCYVANLAASHDERGQSTAEYALVIVAAAALAGVLISFLSKSGVVSGLFAKAISFVTKSMR